MALGRAIRAGAAYVELSVNDSKMMKGLTAAQQKLQSFGAGLRTVGAGLVGMGAAGAAGLFPIIETAASAQEGLAKFSAVFGKESATAGKFVEDLASTVGRSAIDIRDSMSSFQAMMVGLNFNPGAAREMSQALQQAAFDFAAFHDISDEEAIERLLAGMSGSSEVFDKFGINTKAAALDAKLMEMGLAESTAKANEQQKVMARLAIVMESLGKQGATGAAVREAGSFANQMKRMKAGVKDAAAEIGGALLPVVIPLVTKLGNVAQMVAKWAKENPELIATILKIVGVVAAAGVALFVLGAAASAVAAIFTVLSGVVAGVMLVFKALVAVVGFLLSPIGLVTAAVIGLGAVLLHSTGAGGAALDWLRGKFGVLMDQALTVFNAIRDALSSGDFELAAKILWLSLKLAWTEGVAFLRRTWSAFKVAFLKIATEAWFGAAMLLNNAWAGLEKTWVETTAFFSKAWSKFVGFVLSSWNSISGAIRKAWAKVKATVKGTDASAEINRIDNETRRRSEQIQSQTEAEVRAAEQNRQRRRDQIQRDQEGANVELLNRADQINAQRKAAEDQAVADAAADVAKARAELAASIAEVDQAKTGGNEEGPEGPAAPDLQNALDSLGRGAAAAEKAAEANTGAVLGKDEGTKAVLEALRFGGADPAEQTAKNTKALASEMKKLKTEAKETNNQLRKAQVVKNERA